MSYCFYDLWTSLYAQTLRGRPEIWHMGDEELAWHDNGQRALRLCTPACPCYGQPQRLAERWDFLVLGVQWLRAGAAALDARSDWALVQGCDRYFWRLLEAVLQGQRHPLNLEDAGPDLGADLLRYWGSWLRLPPEPLLEKAPRAAYALDLRHAAPDLAQRALTAMHWAAAQLRHRFAWQVPRWDLPRTLASLIVQTLPAPWSTAFRLWFGPANRDGLPLLACDSSQPIAARIALATLEDPTWWNRL